MYQRMRREVSPSCQTLTTAVAAFAKRKCLREGEKLHSFAFRSGVSDAILVASFVGSYAKCSRLASSVQLFEEFSETDSCIWPALNWGFIYCGQFIEVINLFGRMLISSFVPSVNMLQGLVISYRELGVLRLGKATHGYMIRNSYDAQSENSALETSIVKLYASCGSINSAQRCFDSIHQKDIVAWSSMIEAYTIHGYGNVGYHVVFSNARAGSDRWDEVESIRSSMMQQLGYFTFARRRSKMKSCCEVAGVWSWCHSHKPRWRPQLRGVADQGH
uniref:OSJNBa0065J03.22 protein n=1 Tax=Oryza sativa subsp. japonica TaxID=39947 RepID=Q7F9A4_ORYSJ|nr:OSJNBa0065J03.22 [Oryza sativa Japonica Group]